MLTVSYEEKSHCFLVKQAASFVSFNFSFNILFSRPTLLKDMCNVNPELDIFEYVLTVHLTMQTF